jgi:release factor glutamine methyltransferase
MSSAAAPKKIWSILDLITWGSDYLREKGIDDARLTIELLLSHVLTLQRIQLYTSFDRPLSDEELARFKELLKRRLSNEPLQYIIGRTQFMGLNILVDRRVLIPRPETELLVDECVKMMKRAFPPETPLSMIDLGTGSGCIAVALAKMLPSAHVTAVDLSAEALAVAQQNAELNAVAERIPFRQADIMRLEQNDIPGPFHCIISNPPYISTKEFSDVSNDVKDFEPRAALTDESDGLTFYPAIARFAERSLSVGGCVCVEHAYDQSEHVQPIFQKAGFVEPQIIKDYQGIKRHLMYTKRK